MGNCLSAEVWANDDVGPSSAIPEEQDSRGHSYKVKGRFGRDHPALVSPSKRRGAKVSPGGQVKNQWINQNPAEGTADEARFTPGTPSCGVTAPYKGSSLFPGHSSAYGSPAEALSPLDDSTCPMSSSSTSTASSSSSLVAEGCLEEDYLTGEKLGEGRYGTVVACTRRCDGKQFACKVISNSRGARDATMEVDVLHQLRGQEGVVQVEAVYLQRTSGAQQSKGGSWRRPRQKQRQEKDHAPWRVGLGGAATGVREGASDKRPVGGGGDGGGEVEVEEVQIVMERCYGGTLAERLKQQGHFSEAEALRILKTVLSTVELLHSHGIIYRDIKDTNFLFRTKDPDAAVVAIDFGLAATFKEGEVLSEVAGSPLYIAPEVIRHAYGPQCDVWSAGVLLYQMLCGWQPFERDSVTAVLRAVTTDGVLDLESGPWSQVSEPTKQLLESMLTRDPEERATPSSLLARLGGRVAVGAGSSEKPAAILGFDAETNRLAFNSGA